jgi:starch synthase
MRILQVASEAFPLAKTGGLADVVSGLSRALVADGEECRILLPAYRGCAEAAGARPLCELGDPLGTGSTKLLQGRLPGTEVEVWLVDCPALYDREGGPYLDAHGYDWPDNDLRFGLLDRVAAQLTFMGPALGFSPDVVHCHDWQAGLTPAHLAWWGGRRPATVFTIHNLHFHGRFPPHRLDAVGLPKACFGLHGVELHGDASFLKAGLYYADRLTTVSPTYALEIQTPVGGEGMHGLLAARAPDLLGILNGIDDQLWDPSRDEHIGTTYDASSLDEKRRVKTALQTEVGLAVDDRTPLVGWVGRLTGQKGVDLLLGALPSLLERGGQLVAIGSGEAPLQHALRYAAQANPGQIAFVEGYNEPLSHRIIAGSDLLAVPSRFEPCGLTQMYAMRYGTIPLVRLTGGLQDTVIDATAPGGTGFTFAEATAQAFEKALLRALDTFDEPARWAALQRRGMSRSFGWNQSSAAYRALYRAAIAR